jgi:hypothetical protein
MARNSQSGKKFFRISEVITDHGTSLGILMDRANTLMRVEQLLRGFLDSEISTRFQVATIRENRLILISPSASWATQLRMHAPQLVKRLQQSGFSTIEHIDIRVAPVAEQRTVPRKQRELSPAARQALDVMSRIEADDEESEDP